MFNHSNSMPRNEIFNQVFYRNIARQRDIFEGRNSKKFRKALDKQIDQVLDEPFSSISDINRAIERITSEPIREAYTEAYTQTGVYFAGETVKEVNKSYFMGMQYKTNELDDVWTVRMQNYVTDLGTRIKDVTGTTKDIMVRTVQQVENEAFENGWGIERIGREIRQRAKIDNVYRGVRIARTETVNASNYGSLVGAQSTGLPLDKVWLTTRDGRERDSHAEADGQKVDMNNGKFRVGGSVMNHPGDPAGGAEEVINCRCTIIYEPKGLDNNVNEVSL